MHICSDSRKELPPIPKELPWSKQDETTLAKPKSLPSSPVSPNPDKSKVQPMYVNEQGKKKPAVAPKPKKQDKPCDLEEYEDTAPLSKVV